MAQFLNLTDYVNLEDMLALQNHLNLANNGYCFKSCLSVAERAAVPHLVTLGLAVETDTTVYLPESYDIFVVRGLT